MEGVRQYLSFNGDPVEFVERVKAMRARGGSLLFKDGHGIFVEPDLSRKINIDIDTLKVNVYG